jgi:hypothetical protein
MDAYPVAVDPDGIVYSARQFNPTEANRDIDNDSDRETDDVSYIDT